MGGPEDEIRVTAWRTKAWKQLLRDLVSGNVAAQARAVSAFLRVINATLASLGAFRIAPASSWEDLAQEVLVRLCDGADRIEHPAAYVRKCTYTAFVDWCRKQSTSGERVRLSSSHGAETPLLIPEEEVLLKDEIERMRRAVSQLAPDLRRTIEAVYPADAGAEPPSLLEAARALGVRVGTLKNRLWKAKELIRKNMRRENNLGRFSTRAPGSPRRPTGARRAKRRRR